MLPSKSTPRRRRTSLRTLFPIHRPQTPTVHAALRVLRRENVFFALLRESAYPY